MMYVCTYIPIPINMQDGINMQTKIKPCRGNFFSKLIKVHARLFGTLEYVIKKFLIFDFF